MKLDLLNPELRSIYRFVPNTPVNSAFTRALVRRGTGLMKPPSPLAGVRLERMDLEGAPGVHVFTPEGGGTGAALLYITAAAWSSAPR